MVESNVNNPVLPQGNVNVAMPAVAGRKSAAAPVGQEEILFYFQEAVEKSTTLDSLLKSCAVILSRQSHCLGVWVASRDDNGTFNRIHCITDENGAALWQQIAPESARLIGEAVNSGKIHSRQLTANPKHQVVTAPVRVQQETNLVLAVCFDTSNQTATRQHWLLAIACLAIGNWFQQRAATSNEQLAKGRNDALTFFQSLNRTKSTGEAAMATVNHLRRVLNAKQAALSLANKAGECRLTAISDVENIDRLSESNQATARACEQAFFTGELLSYPSADANDIRILPLENYCKFSHAPACLNLPLSAEQDGVYGSVLLSLSAEQAGQTEFVEFAKSLTTMIGNHLDVVLRANRGLKDVAKASVSSLARRKWTKPLLLALALAIGILFIPMSYRIGCECELQPTVRRFVSAPHEGVLEKTLAENGDIINKGDVIATMDGRTKRIELAGLSAEYAGAKKRRDAAMARGDIAQSHIAKTEMNRLSSNIDLLNDELKNLEIKSPIDGIVVSGDLEHVEGAPLELGQVLFEVGPLDQMRAEIAIPEAEIHYASIGMPVVIKLNAFPFKSWVGNIEKIHPRTEIVNDESVFIAEVRLPNDEQLLRPGLKGSAKIKSRTYPLGWNLFHSAWESVRYWMVW